MIIGTPNSTPSTHHSMATSKKLCQGYFMIKGLVKYQAWFKFSGEMNSWHAMEALQLRRSLQTVRDDEKSLHYAQ